MGLHLLAAEARSGYTWRTVATLAEPGLESDQWIGNACLTSSGRRAVVVYAPRTFTNRAVLARRGGFTAVVDMATGAVRKLPVTTSLAYFNPGCGAGEWAMLTQEGDEDLGRTRLLDLDAATGTVGSAAEIPGQVTSAVPAGRGTVAAAGRRLVHVWDRGELTRLAGAVNVPFDLAPDGDEGVIYADHVGSHSRIVRVAAGGATTLATGALGRLGIARGVGGRVFLTGESTPAGRLPARISRLAVPATAAVSTTGQLAVVARAAPASGTPEADAARPVTLGVTVLATGARVDFTLSPGLRPAPESASGLTAAPPAGSTDGLPRGGVAAGSTTSPVDEDRYCSVPRNDPSSQAYQPTPRQVEWAADQAVSGALRVSRPAGFRRFGLPAYTPQGMFPPIALTGGGRVPAQILLGILAQESNLWQASNHALSGEYGNPLVGNIYGRAVYDSNPANDWDIDWIEADCGYGVGQVTDGMRISGHAKRVCAAVPGQAPARSCVQERSTAAVCRVSGVARSFRPFPWHLTCGPSPRCRSAAWPQPTARGRRLTAAPAGDRRASGTQARSPSRITWASRASARRLHPAATVTLTPSRSATSCNGASSSRVALISRWSSGSITAAATARASTQSGWSQG
jgi:hypothetical protein